MIWDIPNLFIVFLNIFGLLLTQLGIAYVFSKIDVVKFRPNGFVCRKRIWENNGEFYQKILHIRKWKKRLPDGGAWFRGGFSKKRLENRNPQYIQRFILETCRAEHVHWWQLAVLPVFAIWNPCWAWLIILFYGLGANVPCLITQRYNRFWLLRIMASLDFVALGNLLKDIPAESETC